MTFLQLVTAGDVLSLRFYGVNGLVILQAGTGASFNIVKLSSCRVKTYFDRQWQVIRLMFGTNN